MQEEKASVTHSILRRHGGHRERIFTEPVMEVLIEQLGQHYYRIRDHLEKPQAVVSEIADYINKKIPGLNLQSAQVYGRMINLQNSLRRYWESTAVGDYKKKPRYYDVLCKVFGADCTNSTAIHADQCSNAGDDIDGSSPNHITVELPEFFDSNTLGSGQYTTSTSAPGPSTTFRTVTGNGREDMWTAQLTTVLLRTIEECITTLRSRPDKYKAWKIITGSVNTHCGANPMTVYQIKVKVKRMLAAVRKYDRQAARGQLFVEKPFYYDTIKILFKKELKPYQRSGQSSVMDGVDNFMRRPAPSALSVSMQNYMRETTALLEETTQMQRDMRDQMRDHHSKILQQLKIFNDTYRMVAVNMINNNRNKRKRDDEDEEGYVEVEELMADDQSDYEEGIIEQEEYDEIPVNNGQHEL